MKWTSAAMLSLGAFMIAAGAVAQGAPPGGPSIDLRTQPPGAGFTQPVGPRGPSMEPPGALEPKPNDQAKQLNEVKDAIAKFVKQRHVSPAQSATIEKALRGNPAHLDLIWADDDDAAYYASDFITTFERAGWTLDMKEQSPPADDPSARPHGVFVMTSNTRTLSATASRLVAALKSAGISPMIVQLPGPVTMPGKPTLLIGAPVVTATAPPKKEAADVVPPAAAH